MRDWNLTQWAAGDKPLPYTSILGCAKIAGETPMANSTVTNSTTYAPVKAPRGTQISCKGWHQEAALRMLMNNLDPEVAERPEELIVYGGTGKAARD